MKKQERKVPQTNQNTIIIESIDSTVDEMSEKDIRMYITIMICKLKNDI